MQFNPLPLLPLLLAVISLIGVYRFWHTAERLGLKRELMWHDGDRVKLHMGIVTTAITLTACGLYGVVLPGLFNEKTWVVNLVIVLLTLLLFFLAKQTGLEVAWFRVRESVLRAVAMAKLISAAELAHALRVSDAYEAARRSGRPYSLDADTIDMESPK